MLRREDASHMAKEKKVEQITDMEVDFAQWFTDVVHEGGAGGLFRRQGPVSYCGPTATPSGRTSSKHLDAKFKADRATRTSPCPCSSPRACSRRRRTTSRALRPRCAWVTHGRQRGAGRAPVRPPHLGDAVLRALRQRRPLLARPAHAVQPVVQRACAGKRPPAPSCAPRSSCGRRATPSTPPRRRPRRRPSRCWRSTPTSART